MVPNANTDTTARATEPVVTACIAPERQLRPNEMPRRRLSPEQRIALSDELQRRWELLKQLSQLNLKRIAGRYGVNYRVVWRFDNALRGVNVENAVRKTGR